MKFTMLFLLLLIGGNTFAQELAKERLQLYNLNKQQAVQGYDVVSYFKGKPIKGSSANSFTYLGVNYHFSTTANLELFKKTPAMYEPAYGGWCAYAMGKDGSKVEVDPETFKIIGNKLFLFYNFYFSNTLKKWNEDEQMLKLNADKNWNNLVSHKK